LIEKNKIYHAHTNEEFQQREKPGLSGFDFLDFEIMENDDEDEVDIENEWDNDYDGDVSECFNDESSNPSSTSNCCLPKDRKYFTSYWKSKLSKVTQLHIRRSLSMFYGFLMRFYPKVSTINDVSVTQYQEYFRFIDHKKICRVSKIKYRQNLALYYKTILLPQQRTDQAKFEFLNNYRIIFSNDIYRFRESGKRRDVILLSKEDVIDIVRFFRSRDFKEYLMAAILAYTGMRVGGLVSIQRRNVDLTNRRIFVYEKPTDDSSGENSYCIPKKLVKDLECYLLEMTTRYPKEQRLFAISTNKVRKHLSYYKKKSISPKLFRNAINSHRAKMGLDESLRCILLNHSVKNINSKHYLKDYLDWQNRLELYDKFFPY